MQYAIKLLSEIPYSLIQFFFFIFFFFFLIRKFNSKNLFGGLLFLKKNSRTLQFLITTARSSGYNTMVSMVLTAFAQSSLLTIGTLIIGMNAWPIVFVAALFSAMIPLVGLLPVSIICVIYAESELGIQKAVIMLCFSLAASVADNILRTFLISGNDTSLNPVLCFFAIVGSLLTFGFSGLFIGPFILVFASLVFKKYKTVQYLSNL